MKKALCAVLALLWIGAAALAGAPKLSGNLFDSAKQALVCLAAGDYESLAGSMPFSGDMPDASDWKRLAKKFADLSLVQTDYAVAFWTGKIWVVAVPVQPPSDGSVEALAFSSEDGASFNAFKYATWSQVEAAYCDSNRVIWDQEYVGGSATVVADQGSSGE